MSHSERPPSAARRRKEPLVGDPFVGRENFPSFDEALAVGLDLDRSSESSSMNLSIGAQAALNEHLRFVAKHGIDQSAFSASEAHRDDSPQQHELSPNNPLDEAWDRLLESDGNNLSNISTSTPTAFHDLVRMDRIVTSWSEEEGVEVLTETSVDYFNSSRILQLQTPEKLRGRKIDAVTSRGEHGTAEESFSSTSEDRSTISATMIRLLQQQQQSGFPEGLAQADHSFASFSAVDISRISADGSEAAWMRRSPDSSFSQPLLDHRSTIDEIRQFLPPIDTTSPVRRTCLGDSFGSTTTPSRMPRSPDDQHRRNNRLRHPSPFGTPKKGPRPGSAAKENAGHNNNNNLESLGLSPIGVRTAAGLSPSASRAAATASQYAMTKSLSNTSLSAMVESHPPPTLPGSLADSPNKKLTSNRRTVGALSSSSSSSLHHEHHQRLSLLVEYDTSRDTDVSPLNTSSDKTKNNSSSSSSDKQEASVQAARSIRLADRRLYRTVVPTRVFLSEPSEFFPEQYDSFSAPVSASVMQQQNHHPSVEDVANRFSQSHL